MPKIFRFVTFATLLALCCAGGGCDSSPAPQEDKRASVPDFLASKSREEKAARLYFLQEWNLRFKKCGDSYYANFLNNGFMCDGKEYLLEIKTSPEDWEVVPITPTEADRANKIKWYCDLTVKAKISSCYSKAERQWSGYLDGTGAFWSLTFYAGGVDIPIIFQVVEYEGGSHNMFASNQYTGNVTVGALSHLTTFFKNATPVTDCGNLPPRR